MEVYMFLIINFERKREYYSDNTYYYYMNRNKSVDIDDAIDFKLAEILIKEL